MENWWSERHRVLDQLNDRLVTFLRDDERKPLEMRMEGYEEELHFRDMKETYLKVNEANQKMHEKRMRDLENLFRMNSLAKDVERLLEKDRQISRETEQVSLRLIELGRSRKIEATKCSHGRGMQVPQSTVNTQTELKQKSRGTQTALHSQNVEKAERRTVNDHQKEMQWAQKRSEIMAQKITERQLDHDMSMKSITENWMERERKSQEEWEEMMRNLENMFKKEGKQENTKGEELLRRTRRIENERRDAQKAEHREAERKKVVERGEDSMRDINEEQESMNDTCTDVRIGQHPEVNKGPGKYLTGKVTKKDKAFLCDMPKCAAENTGVKQMTANQQSKNTVQDKHSEKVQKAERRTANDHQKEMQWAQKISEIMAQKITERQLDHDMSMKRITEKWMERKRKCREEWEERMRYLEKMFKKETVTAKQDVQELLRLKEEQDNTKGEELLRGTRQIENERRDAQKAEHREAERKTVVERGKCAAENTGVKQMTAMQQSKNTVQDNVQLRESKHAQKRDIDSGSNIQTVRDNEQWTYEPLAEETKTKHQALENDCLGDMIQKKEENKYCEMKSTHQLTQSVIKQKVTEQEVKPIVEHKKATIQEMNQFAEIRCEENKNITEQKKQPFPQDTPKETSEKTAISLEKQQPTKEMECLTAPKQKTEKDLGFGKTETKPQHQELENDWFGAMLQKKKEEKLGEPGRIHQQNQPDKKVKETDKQKAQMKPQCDELGNDWLRRMFQRKKEDKLGETGRINQQNQTDMEVKVIKKDKKPVVEQNKQSVKEVDWITEMRLKSEENKNTTQQNNQLFLQDAPKKHQPAQDMAWLTVSNQKQVSHADLGETEIKPQQNKLDNDWLGDMLRKKKEGRLGETGSKQQQDQADIRVKITEKHQKSEVEQKKTNVKDVDWLTDMLQKKTGDRLVETGRQQHQSEVTQEKTNIKQIDWLKEMRQHGGEKNDVIQSKEPPFLQGARRKEAEKQVPQAKTTLEDDWLGDMNAGGKWDRIKKGHEQSQAASTEKLDKHKNNQGQHREKNKGEMINLRTGGNEDIDTDDGERKLFGVSEENADRASSPRNRPKGTDILNEVKQDVVNGKKESLIDGEKCKQECIMKNRKREEIGRTVDSKQLDDWFRDMGMKTEGEKQMEHKSSQPLQTRQPWQESKQVEINLKSEREPAENCNTGGIITTSSRREEKTGAQKRTSKEDLMNSLFNDKEITKEKCHDVTETHQRILAETQQERVKMREQETEMFNPRQKEFVTQEDDGKKQMLRPSDQNSENTAQECSQKRPNVDSWMREWMQTTKNRAKCSLKTNEREKRELQTTGDSRVEESDRKTNNENVVGAKEGTSRTGIHRQQQSLKGDATEKRELQTTRDFNENVVGPKEWTSMHRQQQSLKGDATAQGYRLGKSPNKTGIEYTSLQSDYGVSRSVQQTVSEQQRAAKNATQKKTVLGIDTERSTSQHARALQSSTQGEKNCLKQTSIATSTNIKQKVNSWIDETSDKNEFRTKDVIRAKVVNVREMDKRKTVEQEEMKRELEIISSEQEEKKERQSVSQERVQDLLKPQNQINKQQMERQRELFEIEKQKELKQQKEVERCIDIERQKEQDKQKQMEKLKAQESNRNGEIEKVSSEFKVRCKQGDEERHDLDRPKLTENLTRRTENAGLRAPPYQQNISSDETDGLANTAKKTDNAVVNLEGQVGQNGKHPSYIQITASDGCQKFTVCGQSKSDKIETDMATVPKEKTGLVRHVPQPSINNYHLVQSPKSVALRESIIEPTPTTYTLQPILLTTMRAKKVDKSAENTEKQAALPSSTQSPASGPGDDEREDTESAAPSSAAEMAQGVKSEDAGDSKEEVGSGSEKKDKSVRRRFLGWVNKKAKDYYTNKIEKTIKREQEEGDEIYQSWFKKTPISRAERETEKRQALIKAEAKRQQLEESWKQWEVKKAEEKKQRKKEEAEVKAMMENPDFLRSLPGIPMLMFPYSPYM